MTAAEISAAATDLLGEVARVRTRLETPPPPPRRDLPGLDYLPAPLTLTAVADITQARLRAASAVVTSARRVRAA